MFSEFVSEPLTRQIYGRGVSPRKGSGSSVGVIMWSQLSVPKTESDFSPNHFVVLRRKNACPMEYVDLTKFPS